MNRRHAPRLLIILAIMILSVVATVVVATVAAAGADLVEGLDPAAVQSGYVYMTNFVKSNADAVEVGIVHANGQYVPYGKNQPLLWASGPNTITVTYDGATLSLVHPINGGAGSHTLSFPTGDMGAMNYIGINLDCPSDPNGMGINGIVVNGQSFGDVPRPPSTAAQWSIRGLALTDGFTMTAAVWANDICGNKNGAITISFGSGTVPEPTVATWHIAAAPTTLGIGEEAVVDVSLTDVEGLFAYQFELTYDPAVVDVVSAAFVDELLDSTTAYAPPAWDAVCDAGVCRFALTTIAPATAVSGDGTLARLSLRGKGSGDFTLGMTSAYLVDREGDEIPAVPAEAPPVFSVTGGAQFYGTVSLQGRSWPIDSGTITVIDITPHGSGLSHTTHFSAVDGTFRIDVPVLPKGSDFRIVASHGCYVSNVTEVIDVKPKDVLGPMGTTLRGGDADNDADIDIGDLACIGGDFGGLPGDCGGAGGSDINASGTVNILDLSLSAGNFGLSGPGGW